MAITHTETEFEQLPFDGLGADVTVLPADFYDAFMAEDDNAPMPGLVAHLRGTTRLDVVE